MFEIVATGVPVTVEQYQLALNAAFEAGKVVGINLVKQENMVKVKMIKEIDKAAVPICERCCKR